MKTKKTQLDYGQEIALIKAQLELNPDNKLERQLNDRIKKWLSFCEFEVQVANNETTPWTENELGMKIKPMETKKTTGLYQTGDYVTSLITGDYRTVLGLLIERKTIEDLYGTLMNSENRARFYREINRFHEDHRFNQMIIIVEGTRYQFLDFAPKFKGNKYNKHHIGANVASRRGTLAGILARGIHIEWAGSRAEATKQFKYLIDQWCIKNYEKVIQ